MLGGMQAQRESHSIKKQNCFVGEWQRSLWKQEELESSSDARLEYAALDDIVKITIMLLSYKIKIE